MIIEILKGKSGKRSLATAHICWQDKQNQINRDHSLTDFSAIFTNSLRTSYLQYHYKCKATSETEI